MNKFFITATLAMGFVSSTFAMESEKIADGICFVGQADYFVAGRSSPSIKFSNLIGYKNAADAVQIKSGKRIGLVCDCLVEGYAQSFVFIEEKFAKEDWILADGFKLEYLPTIEYSTGERIGIDCSYVKGLLDFKARLQFVLDYSPKNWFIYKVGIMKLDDSEIEFVELAEKIARSLLDKQSYSNADKIAAYIAFDLIRGACTRSLSRPKKIFSLI